MRWALGAAVVLVAGVAILAAVSRLAADELKPGDEAPDFELPGSDGETYALKDFRGKQAVVLAWFPKAFTPGCTVQCTVLARDSDVLKAFDVAYFTASCDTAEQNAKFAESVGADYPILSDPKGDVARAYGVIGTLRPIPRRWTFFIGKDGKILHIDKDVQTATHASDVAAKLAELGVPKREE